MSTWIFYENLLNNYLRKIFSKNDWYSMNKNILPEWNLFVKKFEKFVEVQNVY